MFYLENILEQWVNKVKYHKNTIGFFFLLSTSLCWDQLSAKDSAYPCQSFSSVLHRHSTPNWFCNDLATQKVQEF